LNDVQFNQKDYYLKPRLLYQNRAYLIWLKDLVSEIKKIDSKRPLIVDLEINQLSKYHSGMLNENIEGIDGLGLVVKNDNYLDNYLEFLNYKKLEHIYSEIDVDVLLQNEEYNKHPSFFITSWKDTHESNKLTFNGITDRKGSFKKGYYKLMNVIQDSNIYIDNSKFRILRQTIPLYANNYLDYYAMVYNEKFGWKYGIEVMDYQFEWSLVKCDKYGNYIAIKDIGSGPVLSLKIPVDHEYFRLLLTSTDGKTTSTNICELNSPVKIK